jgi:hypothetical protein
LAVYICSKCLFCFERVSELKVCEVCGHANVRLATEEEIAAFKLRQASIETGENYIENHA